MSLYESYNKTCRNYDKTRVPIGLEILHSCLISSGLPLSQLRLLDAGCGTGSYSCALIKCVKQIAAVDMCSGMIEVARRKLEQHRQEKRITFYQANIKALPFKSETFDAVMINQVLHHTENTQSGDYPNHRHILQEFHHVLRSKGVLIINTCSQEQLSHSYWYYNLIPETAKAFRLGFMPLDRLTKMLCDCGFTNHDSIVPLDSVFQGDAYFDPLGPLKKEWRDGDSIFALASDQELKTAYSKVREMSSKGILSLFLKEHDRRRESLGQGTFILASRN